MQTKPKNIKGLSSEILASRVKLMNALVAEKKENLKDFHVFISEGNRKTGTLVPSVSLVPVRCCPNCSSCSKFCYDVRNDCVYSGVRNTRAINTAIWECDPLRYLAEIREYIKEKKPKFFRWHIGGDIVNEAYFTIMLQLAALFPNTKFLAFTKNFKLVNSYLDEGGEVPENFQIIFSDWVGQDTPNPHNLPTSHPVFADGSTTAKYGAFFCGGNCSACGENNVGCWTLKKGDQVVFLAH